MTHAVDDSHDPALRSWVASAQLPGTDFPIQNLAYGRFRRTDSGEPWRVGVAIGQQVLDLKLAFEQCPWSQQVYASLAPLARGELTALMSAPVAQRRSLRSALSHALREGSDVEPFLQICLVDQSEIELSLPCAIGDYTDFYAGIHHATAIGKLFRPDQPLLPNYKWLPIGYHGRSSSIRVSGHAFHRPVGQLRSEAPQPHVAPSRRLDYELELGALVGAGNELGDAIPMADAEDRLFGLVLLNDWSARDVQAWEYQPLGPFLAKNFATTLSPWVVTMEALAPYREAFVRPEGDPPPLPYLDSEAHRAQGAIDIRLEAWLQTARMRAAGEPAVRLSTSSFRDSYWSFAQMLAHHTLGGCNLQTGDLFGSGTQSGAGLGEGGSLIELSNGGRQPITLPNGETRSFLQDGDSVSLRGWCEREGRARIGFGECTATVLPARVPACAAV